MGFAQRSDELGHDGEVSVPRRYLLPVRAACAAALQRTVDAHLLPDHARRSPDGHRAVRHAAVRHQLPDELRHELLPQSRWCSCLVRGRRPCPANLGAVRKRGQRGRPSHSASVAAAAAAAQTSTAKMGGFAQRSDELGHDGEVSVPRRYLFPVRAACVAALHRTFDSHLLPDHTRRPPDGHRAVHHAAVRHQVPDELRHELLPQNRWRSCLVRGRRPCQASPASLDSLAHSSTSRGWPSAEEPLAAPYVSAGSAAGPATRRRWRPLLLLLRPTRPTWEVRCVRCVCGRGTCLVPGRRGSAVTAAIDGTT